jgi:3-deoxy-D-manno-octulosonate 8-phosphate phosphatase (KDO 8-P phosphatase)
MKPPLAQRVRAIEWLVLDVDGVLTDGRIAYTDAGAELQAFHVRDGSGLALWHRAGKRTAIITGRGSAALERRAKELNVEVVVQHAADKAAALAAVLQRCSVERHAVCAMGDDWPDLPVLRQAGVAVAVADACLEVRAAADHVTRHGGGRGAVREAVEWLLKVQGSWNALVPTARVAT